MFYKQTAVKITGNGLAASCQVFYRKIYGFLQCIIVHFLLLREAPWSSGKSGSIIMQKVAVKREFETGLRHAMTGKLCQPSSKWVSFSDKGKIRQRKERDGLRLSSAVSKIQWDSNPDCPTAIRLWETFTLFFSRETICDNQLFQ